MPDYPSPQPTPVATPTAVATYNLSNIPSNAYQLLSAFADALDTANKHLNIHASKLQDIQKSTNNAVGEVISTSKGLVTDTLTDVWHGSTTDLNTSHNQLSTITTYQGGLGYATTFRNTLDASKASIQNGLIALENLQNQQSGRGAPVSPEQIAQWQQDIDSLENELGNINLVIDAMAMLIRKLNNGFAAACATGFVPGGPLPNFPKNAFTLQMSAGSSGSADENILTKIKNALKKASKNKLEDALAELQAMGLMVDAWDAGIEDPGVITDLLNNGKSADAIEQALTDAKLIKSKGISGDAIDTLFKKGGNIQGALDNVTTLLDKGINSDAINTLFKKGGDIQGSLDNVTTLLDKGVNSDQINQLINNGADLKSTVTNVTTLLDQEKVPIKQVNQWIQKGLDLKYADVLLNKKIDINKWIDIYTKPLLDTDPGYKRWEQLGNTKKSGIDAAIKRWAIGDYLKDANGNRIGNDGTIFANRNGEMPRNTTTPPYMEYRVNNDGMRIVVDANGKVYFFEDHYEFSGGRGKNAALPVPFSYIMQLFKN